MWKAIHHRDYIPVELWGTPEGGHPIISYWCVARIFNSQLEEPYLEYWNSFVAKWAART